jgi:3-isopropylmalate/(R)-2-methylmalate dehydratase small subunit
MRFGFKGFIGGSFAEIFFGNCTALGLPCVTLEEADLAKLMDTVELDPTQTLTIDLQGRKVHSRAGSLAAGIPDGTRQQLLEGSWDATRVLLEAGGSIEETAQRLPYIEIAST